MLKKIFISTMFTFIGLSNFLSAVTEYDIKDIGTLQTYSSQTIALNNKGQMIGWYNIDGTANGKHFFFREIDGSFYELPEKDTGSIIEWKFLTDNGKVYGTYPANPSTTTLHLWDRQNGFVKLGNIPGKDVVAVNTAGQVLIKSVTEYDSKRNINMTRPVVWQNGVVTKLKGLEGNIGIESEESCGFSINNRGEVVGQSLVHIAYKDKIYKQTHATKWVNGQAIDLHNKIPKTNASCALAINDLGEILIQNQEYGKHLLRKDGGLTTFTSDFDKLNNAGYVYHNSTNGQSVMYDRDKKEIFSHSLINQKIQDDLNSIWLKLVKVVSVNEKGSIVAEGETIYGEKHALYLIPLPPKNAN